MSASRHIVFDLRNEDGTFRTYLTPERIGNLLRSLTRRAATSGVSFSITGGFLPVIMMDVAGRDSGDVASNTWLRRQAEEFTRGYLAGLMEATMSSPPCVQVAPQGAASAADEKVERMINIAECITALAEHMVALGRGDG